MYAVLVRSLNQRALLAPVNAGETWARFSPFPPCYQGQGATALLPMCCRRPCSSFALRVICVVSQYTSVINFFYQCSTLE